MRRVCNHCCRVKAVGITYYKCVFVALGIQHAMRMSLIFIHGLSGSTVFSTLSYKQKDFRENVIEPKMYVSTFCTTFVETFLILSRTERDMIINVYLSLCKVRDFHETRIFSTDFRKILKCRFH